MCNKADCAIKFLFYKIFIKVFRVYVRIINKIYTDFNILLTVHLNIFIY